jgi:regulator of protease activity HflC (stomatin/prohibitin superfamily)
MEMLRSFAMQKYERGVLLKSGDFERVLGVGRHNVFDVLGQYSVVKWKLDAPMTDLELVDYLEANDPGLAAQYFVDMQLADDEAGLRYENGNLVEVLSPGSRRVFWTGLIEQRLDRVDLRLAYEVAPDLARRFLQPALRARPIVGVSGVLIAQVPADHVGVLRVDGKVIRLMEPGVEVFWRFNRDISVEMVDLRLQTMEVTGQEILSSDKVGLRLNLAATRRYTDVLLAYAKLAKPVEHLYRELQLGLRAAVGTRSLDQLLENKQLIDEVVSAHTATKLAGFGLELVGIGVKDIVLPGEMKTILARVVEAAKSAEANVIRRREEAAATRSLLNTAKVMEDRRSARTHGAQLVPSRFMHQHSHGTERTRNIAGGAKQSWIYSHASKA